MRPHAAVIKESEEGPIPANWAPGHRGAKGNASLPPPIGRRPRARLTSITADRLACGRGVCTSEFEASC